MTVATKKATKRAPAEAVLKDATAASSVKASAKPAKAAPASGSRADSSGKGKAARLTEALEPFGWKVAVKTGPGDRIEATAKRGTEQLRQVWINGGYDYGASEYTNGDTSRKVRNLSEAIRLYGVAAAS